MGDCNTGGQSRPPAQGERRLTMCLVAVNKANGTHLLRGSSEVVCLAGRARKIHTLPVLQPFLSRASRLRPTHIAVDLEAVDADAAHAAGTQDARRCLAQYRRYQVKTRVTSEEMTINWPNITTPYSRRCTEKPAGTRKPPTIEDYSTWWATDAQKAPV